MPEQCMVAHWMRGKGSIKERDNNIKEGCLFSSSWQPFCHFSFFFFYFAPVLLPKDWQTSSSAYSDCNVNTIIWLRIYSSARNWRAHFKAPESLKWDFNTFHLKLDRKKKQQKQQQMTSSLHVPVLWLDSISVRVRSPRDEPDDRSTDSLTQVLKSKREKKKSFQSIHLPALSFTSSLPLLSLNVVSCSLIAPFLTLWLHLSLAPIYHLPPRCFLLLPPKHDNHH